MSDIGLILFSVFSLSGLFWLMRLKTEIDKKGNAQWIKEGETYEDKVMIEKKKYVELILFETEKQRIHHKI